MQTNLILIGAPGSGKSTIGRILAEILEKEFLDLDDYLENKSSSKVAAILDQIGDEAFLDYEATQTLTLNVTNHIISTTGSSPLRPHALQHLHQNGIVIYLETPTKIIENRLHKMQIDRIVGLKNQTIGEILKWRKEKFYEKYPYDFKIKIKENHSPQEIAQKIKKIMQSIKYKSTRGETTKYTFSEALLKGIAIDGGLLVPTKIPQLSQKDILELSQKTYTEKVIKLLQLFETDLNLNQIQKIASQAYAENFDTPEITPLRKLKDNQYILELWHGPTSAFKDLALQFKPLCFAESIKKENQKLKQKGKNPYQYLILTATSGDTGKAALEGYKDQRQIKIIVFYPKDGVSEIQKKQMLTQRGDNLMICGIKGNFDDTQNAVKSIFNDKKFNIKLNQNNFYLSSANSINWGRILPQIFYYINAYCELLNKKIIQCGKAIDIAVPTGNFGNILAAYYAKLMGLPIDKLICASNENDVLTEFILTGTYDISKRELIKTPSPSMDILISSNLERLLYEITKDPKEVKFWMQKLKQKRRFTINKATLSKIQKNFKAGKCKNVQTLETIKKIYDQTGYLLDTHTAVVQNVVEQQKKTSKPTIIVSTAHWAKFGSDVYRALNGMNTEEKIERLDEFEILEEIEKMTNKKIPENLANLKNQATLHKNTCGKAKAEIQKIVLDFALKNIK